MAEVALAPGVEVFDDVEDWLAAAPGVASARSWGAKVTAVHRAQAAVEAHVVALAGEVDGSGVWAMDGAVSAPTWLAGRGEASRARAAAQCRQAEVLRAMPVVAAAARAGRLGAEKVRALIKAREPGLEAVFAVCEEMLVSEIEGLTVAATYRYLRRWATGVRDRLGLNHPDGPEPADGQGRSKVRLSAGFEGRWSGDLDLSASDGEIVAGALDEQVDLMWRTGAFTAEDGLTMPERRASALVELVTRATRGGDDDGTARPLILALADLATLQRTLTDGPAGGGGPADGDPDESGPGDRSPSDDADAPGEDRSGPDPAGDDPTGRDDRATRGRAPARHRFRGTVDPRVVAEVGAALGLDGAAVCELSRSGPVPAATLARLACEGDIHVLLHGPGDVLRQGRRHRIATRAQRRALRARDGHCRFAGCSTAAEHCIAHHLTPWEAGGTTDLANLALVCRYHHRRIHDDGYTLTRTRDGTLTTRRPDRTPVTPALRDPPPTSRPPPLANQQVIDATLTRIRLGELTENARAERRGRDADGVRARAAGPSR